MEIFRVLMPARNLQKTAETGTRIARAGKKTHGVGVSLDIEFFNRLSALASGEMRPPSDLAKAILSWGIEAFEQAGGSSKTFLEGKWVPKEPEK